MAQVQFEVLTTPESPLRIAVEGMGHANTTPNDARLHGNFGLNNLTLSKQLIT